MATTSLRSTLMHLRRWVEEPGGDSELLRRFAAGRDEAAFAELVRRHGSLVLGVARRVLGDHHAAEDVLQATFLLLARKAWRVQWRRTVAPWLHAAAYRIACEARRRRMRQPMSLQVHVAGDEAPERPLLWQEVRSAVDEELSRLSAPLRAPLVLCYLQGLTRDEAALRLGWTLATLKRRLERGRNLLRIRLTRRGVALSATVGLLAADEAISGEAVREVMQVAAGGVIPGRVAALLGDSGRWRRLSSIVLLLAAGISGVALGMKPGKPADPPALAKPAAAERTDLLGDPLPAGALARFGSLRHRPGMLVQKLDWSPDGKRLAVWGKAWGFGGRDRLIISDVETGRELRVVELPKCDLLATRWLPDGRGLAVLKYGPNDDYVWEFTNEQAPPPDRENAELGRWTDGNIKIAAISPDGRWLATCRFAMLRGAKAFEVWPITANSSLKDAKPIELGRHEGQGVHVLFTPDSKHVFAMIQQLQAGNRFMPAGGPPMPPPAAVVPTDQARVVAYDLAGRKQVSEFGVPLIQDLFSNLPLPPRLLTNADGQTLYLGDAKGTIHAYDWARGSETATFAAKADDNPPKFSGPGVASLALGRDGNTFYSTTSASGLTAWDLTKSPPAPTTLAPAKLQFEAVVPAPDGTRLAVATRSVVGDVRVLDVRTGAERPRPAVGHDGMILGMGLTPDGNVVTAALDGSVRWWDARDGKPLRDKAVNPLHTWALRPNVTADGRGLFVKDDENIVHIDLESGAARRVNAETVKPVTVALGVSGSTVFHNDTDGKVRQWDATDGRVRAVFDPPRGRDGKPAGIEFMSMSPDGKQVVMLSSGMQMSGQFGWFSGAQISLYDAATGELTKRWQTTEARFECAAWSRDGQHLLVGGLEMRSPAANGPIDNQLPISAKSGLLLFDARSGEPVRSLDLPSRHATGMPMMVATLEFSPDGNYFALAQSDAMIHIYELATGRVCKSFRGHRARVTQFVFTERGRRLISVSHDMTGLVWDVSLANLAKPADVDAEHIWAALAAPEWEVAGGAVAALAAKPDELPAFVRSRLAPAGKPGIDAEAVARLVAQLDDRIFAVRDRAAAALSRLSRDALPLLQDHLAKVVSAEARKRLQQALRDVAATPVPSERLRELRVVALLEQASTDSAKAELKRLTTGHPDAPLTRDATAALKRN